MSGITRPIPLSNDATGLQPESDGVAAILAASETLSGQIISTQSSNSNAASLDPTTCVQQIIANDDEAALILDSYQTHMSLYFPFVAISPGQTVHELKQAKPFLFMVIMTVGCRHDVPRQTALARKARELISHKMLLGGEQNLDLLQGLLVFIAWYHVQAGLGPQLSNLTHLAMALMIDLGLNKAVSPRGRPALGSMGYFRASDGQNTTERTLAERRVFLGILYVTTAVSIWARDMEPLKYSMYADECCRVLEQANEHANDEQLVIMTRIMSLVGKIKSTFSPEEWEPSSGMSAPVGICVKSFEAELEQLKTRLPTGTQAADFVSLHYAFLEVFLYEVSVNDTIASTRYGAFPVTRLKMLFTCLDAVKRFFEKFRTISPSLYFNFTYFTWSLAGHVSVVLSKLCIFAEDGWDPSLARSTIDFPAMIDEMQSKLRVAADLAEHSTRQPPQDRATLPFSVPELFKMFTHTLRGWKESHMYKTSQLGQQSQATIPTPSGTDALPSAEWDDGFLNSWDGNLFDFIDSDYWPQLT
ncbi:hypothetical protein EDD37DRAFT_219756 [Exophiala viscosa]|uniref:Transcription factor domain-containing protein n=1 Tax=Exophiala viscosa TaxID=2486360 RepID=A0AAN6E4U3_9EURO|nr:hypothetical protein EDD36DRAFT_459136 [Exophiala viscosa]KAI1626580.1 hypothetical protein EDD37DRAFT_219756 [Exophiala viscosa]